MDGQWQLRATGSWLSLKHIVVSMLLPTIASPLWEGPLVGTHEFFTGQNEDLNLVRWSPWRYAEKEHILGHPKVPTRYPVVANTLTHYPKDRCGRNWVPKNGQMMFWVIGVLSYIFPSFLRQFHPFLPEIPPQPSHEGRDGPLKPVATNSALLVQSWGLEEVRLGQWRQCP